MKQFKISTFLLILILSSFITSCDESNDTVPNDLESNFLKEPEWNNDFSLSGDSSESNTSNKIGIGTTWTIGRKSKNCHRLGICKLKSVTITVSKTSSPQKNTGTTIMTNLQKMEDKFYVVFNLNNYLDSTIYDTNFYIDEDIIDDNIIVNKGIYKLDSSIGEFGGYKIPVDYNK